MARIAENTVIVDGQEYKPGDVIPDFKSIKCVDTREPRKYQGLSADVSVLNDVIAKYASGGASCFMSDTGEYYEYDRKEKTWKLITNITERGFDSEKAYGALKHMLKNVTVSDEKIQSAVTDYLTVNPVLPGATTEQAQQIEQNKTDVASLKEETGSLKEDFARIENAFNGGQSANLCNPNALTIGALDTNGKQTSTSAEYKYTDYIKVDAGQVLSFYQGIAQYQSLLRFVTAYDSSKTVVEDSGFDSIKGTSKNYTIPDGISYIRATLKVITALDYMILADAETTPVEFIAYGFTDYTIKKSIAEDAVKAVLADYDNHNATFSATAFSLVAGTQLIACNDIDGKKNDVIHLIAYFSSGTFDAVTIGHGKSGNNYGSYLVIDRSNVTIYSGAKSTALETFAHGLSGKIDKWISVEIIHYTNARASLRIMSIGGEFKTSTVDRLAWDGCQGDVFVSATMDMTNVTLKATYPDFSKDVILFGDSYTSVGDPARYPKHLIDAGIDVGIFGWGGETVAYGIETVGNVLARTNPKIAVWAYGMNNADTDSAINADWKEKTEKFISICKDKNITPMLATIPCVPTRNNIYKNAYVRQSGYRYIDFASIVGANNSGATWHDGMLEALSTSVTERVHPTELGAKALYHQFLIDVPEAIAY